MPWIELVVAGLLEVVWSVGLKYTSGFTRPLASVIVGSAIVASMVLLARAVRSIPIGTAYAVWVGIGTLGAVIMGMVHFDEPRSAARIGFLVMLGVSIVGLKMSSGS